MLQQASEPRQWTYGSTSVISGIMLGHIEPFSRKIELLLKCFSIAFFNYVCFLLRFGENAVSPGKAYAANDS